MYIYINTHVYKYINHYYNSSTSVLYRITNTAKVIIREQAGGNHAR